MAEKTQKATVQERSKKIAMKPAESTQAAMLAAKRALLLAQNKLAARNAGIKADVQPLTLEDVAMTVEDPGLQDAMQFSERLRTGESRILSPEEAAADREEAAKQIAELQRLAVQKFGSLRP